MKGLTLSVESWTIYSAYLPKIWLITTAFSFGSTFSDIFFKISFFLHNKLSETWISSLNNLAQFWVSLFLRVNAQNGVIYSERQIFLSDWLFLFPLSCFHTKGCSVTQQVSELSHWIIQSGWYGFYRTFMRKKPLVPYNCQKLSLSYGSSRNVLSVGFFIKSACIESEGFIESD